MTTLPSAAAPFRSPPVDPGVLLRLLAEQTPAVIWTTDADLRFTSYMGGALRYLGLVPDQSRGLSLYQYFGTQDPEFTPIAHHRRALAGEKTSYEFEWAGRVFHTRVEPFHGTDGRIIGTLGLALDTTERKRAEAALQESEARWKGVVTQAPDFILILDLEGRIFYINRMSRGYTPEEVIGRSTLDFILPSFRAVAERAYRRAYSKGEIVTYTVEAQVDKERTAWFQNRVGPLYSNGKIVNLILVSTDITEQKSTEEALQGSLRSLRQLASRLQSVREEERARIALEIHDRLGQALTGLKLDLSSLESSLPRAARGRIKGMYRSLDETIRTVRRISTELRPAVLDNLGLKEAVEWQAREFGARSGLPVRLKLPSGPVSPGRERATALFRIFQELLTNIARHAKARRVDVSLSATPRLMRLTVSDDGVGIARKSLADPASLGILGMRERALEFGGDVVLGRRKGRGTRAVVRIPWSRRGGKK